MATVMIVEEVVEVLDDAEVHVVPSTRTVRRRCDMENMASTSSSTHSNTEYTPRPRKLAKRRSQGFSKSLQALEDRKRKVSGSRVKAGKRLALKLRKIKAKCNKQFDRKMLKRKESLRQLEAERQALRQQSDSLINKCERLVETTREMRIQAEFRQNVQMALLFSHLVDRSHFF